MSRTSQVDCPDPPGTRLEVEPEQKQLELGVPVVAATAAHTSSSSVWVSARRRFGRRRGLSTRSAGLAVTMPGLERPRPKTARCGGHAALSARPAVAASSPDRGPARGLLGDGAAGPRRSLGRVAGRRCSSTTSRPVRVVGTSGPRAGTPAATTGTYSAASDVARRSPPCRDCTRSSIVRPRPRSPRARPERAGTVSHASAPISRSRRRVDQIGRHRARGPRH